MAFEKFTEKGRGWKPVASIRSNGQIGFNRGCIRRYKLEDGHVSLYYDVDNKLIGIERGANEADDGAHRIIVKSNNAFIGARAFLNWYGIPFEDGTKRFEMSPSDDDNMLIIDLNKNIGSSQKKGR